MQKSKVKEIFCQLSILIPSMVEKKFVRIFYKSELLFLKRFTKWMIKIWMFELPDEIFFDPKGKNLTFLGEIF